MAIRSWLSLERHSVMHLSPRSFLAGLALSLLACAPVAGQLTPQRLYYGVGGRIEMEVRVPLPAAAPLPASASSPQPPLPEQPSSQPPTSATDTPGPLEILLIRPDGQVVETASVLAGGVDLASLFPALWKSDKHELCYAQLRAGEKRIGPPVVLQPMLAPQRATATDPRGQSVRFAPSGQPYFAGLRAYGDKRVVLDTSFGEIEIALRPDAAPNTAWNFRHLVEGGFYNGLSFHRIYAGASPDQGYVLQAGDPLGNSVGGPGYSIDLEPSTLPHDFGVVSMARLTTPDTAGSQFLICLSRERCKRLDGGYASFGQVVRGEDVVRAIARAPVTPDNRPTDPPLIRTAKLVDAPPMPERSSPPPASAPRDR